MRFCQKKFRQKLLSVLEEGNVKFQLFWENWTLKPKWKVFPHKIGCYCCCISLFQQKQPLLAEIIHLDTFGASAEMGKNIFRSPTIETDIDRGGEEQGPASVRRSLMSMQSGTHRQYAPRGKGGPGPRFERRRRACGERCPSPARRPLVSRLYDHHQSCIDMGTDRQLAFLGCPLFDHFGMTQLCTATKNLIRCLIS